MDLQRIKDLAFRHCEKAVLAIILVFVGLNVSSNLTEQEEGGKGGPPRVPPPRVVSRAVQPQIQAILSSFTETADPVRLSYDPTHPPEMIPVPLVALRIPGEKEKRKEWPYKDKDIRRFDGKTVGEFKEVRSNAGDIKDISKDMLDQDAPCKVDIAVDPEKNEIAFHAVKEGKPRTFEWKLASADWLRLTVVVEPEGHVQKKDYGKAEIAGVGEPTGGVVTLRILEPAKAKDLDERDPATKHIDPTAYYIWRQAEGEKEPTKIGRVKAFGKVGAKAVRPAGERPKPAAPAGFPDEAEHKRPPVTVKGGAPAVPNPDKLERNEITFDDRNTESGVAYLYSIESVVEDEDGNPVKGEETRWDKDHKWTALERFNLVYIGGTPPYEARIRVLVGSRDNPQASQEFRVYIGERIGDATPPKRTRDTRDKSGKKGVKAPPPGDEAEGKEGKEGEAAGGPHAAANPFATGFILVDIIPDQYRLIEQMENKWDAEKKAMVQVKSYRPAYQREIVVRERKGRLVVYGLQSGPLKVEGPPPKEAVPAKEAAPPPKAQPKAPGGGIVH